MTKTKMNSFFASKRRAFGFAVGLSLAAGSAASAAEAAGPDIPAFPGAEGFGSHTPGGRGGKVIFVTNLDDSGPGSFRAACDASGPRTVIFQVAGTIVLKGTIAVTYVPGTQRLKLRGDGRIVRATGRFRAAGGVLKVRGHGPITLRSLSLLLTGRI